MDAHQVTITKSETFFFLLEGVIDAALANNAISPNYIDVVKKLKSEITAAIDAHQTNTDAPQ